MDLPYFERLNSEQKVSCDVEEYCSNSPMLTQKIIEIDQQLLACCEHHTTESLLERVEFARINGELYSEQVQAVLTRLFLHQTHHCGQVHDMLISMSVASPQLDEYFLASDLELGRAELQVLRIDLS